MSCIVLVSNTRKKLRQQIIQSYKYIFFISLDQFLFINSDTEKSKEGSTNLSFEIDEKSCNSPSACNMLFYDFNAV